MLKPMAAHDVGWTTTQAETDLHALVQTLKPPAAWTMLDLLWEDIMETELELDRARNQLAVARELLGAALTRLHTLHAKQSSA